MVVEREVDGSDREEMEVEERCPVTFCVGGDWKDDRSRGRYATVDGPAFLSIDWRRETRREGQIFVQKLIRFVRIEAG